MGNLRNLGSNLSSATCCIDPTLGDSLFWNFSDFQITEFGFDSKSLDFIFLFIKMGNDCET